MPNPPTWDAIIIGGGPAGLSAALVLARCNRTILVCDGGKQRNLASHVLHSFLTRDGVAPAEFLRLAREGLSSYPAVEIRRQEVVDASKAAQGRFRIRLAGGGVEHCRKVLLATGLIDEMPRLRGIDEIYGRSAFHCPYCDGWELRGRPLAVYGRKRRAYEMCRALTAWSDDIVLCSDGPCGLSRGQRDALTHNGIQIVETVISNLSSRDGQLQAIVFQDGATLPRAALFFDTPSHGRSDLARRLGCQFRADGGVRCTRYEATSVPGAYVAGNIIRDVQLVAVAAAEGAKAAFGINQALTREGFELKATGKRKESHPDLNRGENPPIG